MSDTAKKDMKNKYAERHLCLHLERQLLALKLLDNICAASKYTVIG
jgi:hypothetical protein